MIRPWLSLKSSKNLHVCVRLLSRMFSTYVSQEVADSMLQAPAAERNKGPILELLKEYLPENSPATVLELASGTGQHITHFAKHFKNITWQPSDIEEKYARSIDAYAKHLSLSNVLPTVSVDATQDVAVWNDGQFSAQSFDAVYNANMIHISPWDTALGLFKGSGYLVKPGGFLFLYGPFAFNGVLSPDSNVKFDEYLKSQDSRWGVRDVKDLKLLAQENQMTLVATVPMPSNNYTLVFKKMAES